MHGATEWLLVGLAVALVLGVGGMLAWLSRTSVLTRRVGSVPCAVADDASGPWRAGIAQYGRVRMYWWRLDSLAPRAAAVWPRSGIVVLERRPEPEVLTPGERAVAVVVRCRVTSPGGTTEVSLRMSPDACAGFTSWIEATPAVVRRVI